MTTNPDPSRAALTTRRSVLGGVAAGLGMALVGPASQATAAGATVRVTPLPGRTWVATANSSVVQVPTSFGARLEVVAATVRAGSTVVVSFDDRLYALGAPTVVTDDGRVLACRLTAKVAQDSTGLARATVTLDEPLLPEESYRLSLGVRRLTRFPHDIVDSPAPTQIRVVDRSVGTPTHRLAASPEVDQAVWGLIVGAGWQAVHWGAGFHSWLPELVTVRATGPADLPAGTTVTVTLDARLFPAAQLHPLAGPRTTGRSRAADGVVSASWILRRSVPAGHRVSARLETSVAAPSADLPGLHPPTVAAWPSTEARGQRSTGQESLSREDSACDVSTRATYGLDLVTPFGPR